MWNLKNKIWYVIYAIIPKRLPTSRKSKIAKRMRNFCAKRIVKKFGVETNIEKNAFFNPLVELGDYSGIGMNCELHGPVIIKNNVMMGQDCLFFTQNHEFSNTDELIRLQGMTEPKNIVIEDDVWIGARCIFLPGVKSGKGCVIGAGSIVTKSFPDYSVIAGNPAKIIKKRK